MTIGGPMFERGLAAGLLVFGVAGCWWLQGRVDGLERATAWRLQAVRATENLRMAGAADVRVGEPLANDPFPDHQLSWQHTLAGLWLCLRPSPERNR